MLDLDRAWRRSVVDDLHKTRFTAGSDDTDWKAGDEIVTGLKLNEVGDIVTYAHNETADTAINRDSLEEVIPNTGGISRVFNPYRGLRPGAQKTHAAGPQPKLDCSVQACGFKCQEPDHPWSLLKREPLGVIASSHETWIAVANFAPIEANGSFIIVPTRFESRVSLPHVPQIMTRERLADGLDAFNASIGLMWFWNSAHAGATQPGHFHYQAVVTGDRLYPLALQCVPEGGSHAYLHDYPIAGLAFPLGAAMDVEVVWSAVSRFQDADIPFNLIMLNQTSYLIPRNAEAEVTADFPYGVWGSLELAGRLILSNAANYQSATTEKVLANFLRIGIARERIVEVTGLASTLPPP